jgi:thiol:disulfide interchange protein DsbD
MVKQVLVALSLLYAAGGIASELSHSVSPVVKSITAPAGDALLDPAEAFKPVMRVRDPWTAELKFTIAPGYHLYQDKIQVEAEPNLATVATEKGEKSSPTSQKRPPTIASSTLVSLALSPPAGRVVDDPTFGKVAIYEGTVVIPVDLSRLPRQNGVAGRGFLVKSQGCATAGVCFPAQVHRFTLDPNASATSAAWQTPAASPQSVGFGRSTRPRSLPPALSKSVDTANAKAP